MTLLISLRNKIQLVTQGNPDVLLISWVSAALLILARCSFPLLVPLDEGTQIEAAQNLVLGKGLISLFSAIPDSNLNIEPHPGVLTWWPPGFSLLLACFLSVKIPLSVSLKIIYSACTAIGWYGWGVIASYLLSFSISFRKIKIPLNTIIAGMVPLFYTPKWANTDIFLWAGIPFILILLIRPKQSDLKRHYHSISVVGLLIGLLYAFRYASLGILMGTLLLIGIKYWKRKQLFFGTLLLLCINFGLIYFPIFIYNSNAGNNIGLPEYISLESKLLTPQYTFKILREIYHVIALLGYPTFPRRAFTPNAYVENILSAYPWIYVVLFILSSTFLLLIPLLIYWKIYKHKSFSFRYELGFFLLQIFLVNSVFLFVASFLFDFNFFGNFRYYLPFLCLYIYLFYSFLSQSIKMASILRKSILFYLITLCLSNTLFPAIFYFFTVSDFVNVASPPTSFYENLILGYKLASDSRDESPFVTRFDSSAKVIEQLVHKNPESIFFLQYPSAYFNRPFQRKLRIIPLESFWASAYVIQDTKVFFISTRDQCPSICSSYLPDQPLEPLLDLPNLNFEKGIYERYRVKVYSTVLHKGMSLL